MAKQEGARTSSHICSHPFERLRRENAEKRQTERNNRTAREQIAALDAKLGVGVGAVRERTRLAKLNPDAKPVALIKPIADASVVP
jgi:hypothetical protein